MQGSLNYALMSGKKYQDSLARINEQKEKYHQTFDYQNQPISKLYQKDRQFESQQMKAKTQNTKDAALVRQMQRTEQRQMAVNNILRFK